MDPDAGMEITASVLKRVSRNRKKAVIKYWFLQNYGDPANSTPYDSREGGYIYINGGPFNAESEIGEYFGDLVDYTFIRDVAKEIEDERSCYDWVYSSSYIADNLEDFYDIDAVLDAPQSEAPFNNLGNNVQTLRELIDKKDALEFADLQRFQLMMIFSFCITTLETYLSDTFTKHVFSGQEEREKYLQNDGGLKDKNFKYGEIYRHHAKIDEVIKEQISNTSFHNLGRVKPLFKHVMSVDMPDISGLSRAVKKRHDFIHRGGKDANGDPVSVTKEETLSLVAEIEKFCTSIENQINDRVPF